MPHSATACGDVQRARRLQVPLQHAEFANALRYMANVLVKQCIDLATVLCRRIAKLNQCADLVQGHI